MNKKKETEEEALRRERMTGPIGKEITQEEWEKIKANRVDYKTFLNQLEEKRKKQ